MRRYFVFLIAAFSCLFSFAQTPKTYTSSEILLQLKKLNVLGSVLYIAAHPDDENTRLLAYLANEKLYRTGYLSLTRGDGGQNLIGDEQGIDLGLIRTQELLSARRIDGAEQFFSRAYDFGFCKTADEALQTWGHDKILSDVVWVIRKFRPDVIITRFPGDTRAGHGHHAASSILAREAFDAAADPAKFPEQLSLGVTVWQAKRILWNTYNFGGNNTQSEDQFKLDAGAYNPLLGKGYGEIAALSRSQHKSQGFGVSAQRGSAIEYFSTLKGDKPVNDLMDGVASGWARVNKKSLTDSINSIIRNYDVANPERSVSALMRLKQIISATTDPATWPQQNNDGHTDIISEQYNYWASIKNSDIDKLIESAGGLFMEAAAVNQLNVIGDSIKLNLVFNNRTGIPVDKVTVSVFGGDYIMDNIKINENKNRTVTIAISDQAPASQPYWLENGLVNGNGSFDVKNQAMIGNAQNYNYFADFQLTLGNSVYHFLKPVLYKYADPVKGELYQPIQVVNPVFVSSSQHLIIFKNDDKDQKKELVFTLQFNNKIADAARFSYNYNGNPKLVFDSSIHVSKSDARNINVTVNSDSVKKDSKGLIEGGFSSGSIRNGQFFTLAKIKYDHIPDIFYNYYDRVTVLKMDLKTVGKTVGYIPGAGDKVPQALEQMGYKVTVLKQADITHNNLKQFDAIVTGVRTYNVNDWMNTVYTVLMDYVKEGGVLLVQYNTSNQIGNVTAKIAPFPFVISRNRVTDENAKVNFLLPDHPVLNYPNKITPADFEGWIQERSIYNAEKTDSSYQRVLSMKDPNEDEQEGSLIVSKYGKGKFVYTGLVFFRELPAGVPGAYRLFANLIAPNKVSEAGALKKDGQHNKTKK